MVNKSSFCVLYSLINPTAVVYPRKEINGLQIYNVIKKKKAPFTSMDWYVHLPFESAHNSDDAKTPVAVIVSLQITPL